MRFRFTLSHENLGSLEINEPDGWNGGKIILERHEDFGSLIQRYEGSAGGAFIFYGDNGVENGGVDFIRQVEQTYGFDASITFEAEYAGDDLNFETIFTGLLDLTSKVETPDNKMKIAVIRNDFWTKFINRMETPVNLSDLIDLDGNAVSAVPPININLTSQTVQKEYYGVYDYPPRIAIDAPDGYIQTTPDNNKLNEIDEAFNLGSFYNAERPSWFFEMQEAGSYAFDVRIIMSVALNVTSGPPDGVFFATSLAYDFVLQHNDTLYIFDANDVGSTPTGYTEYTINQTINVNAGDKVWIYGVELENLWGVFTIWSTQGGKFIYTVPDPDEEVITPNITPYEFPSYVRVVGQTTSPDTEAQGYLIHDAIYGVLQRIGLGNSPLYSEFLGSTRTNSFQYDEDGCGWMYTVIKGLQLRQYSLTEKPFFISFKQLWDGINPILNLGLGYEDVDGVEKIRIEQKSHFFDVVPELNISDIRDISSSYDTTKIFKTVKVGYKKWQSEGISGLDDPQTKKTYATKFEKAGVDLLLESEFIAASIAIEVTRRTTRQKSADYRFDNETFIIALNEDDVSPDRYAPELTENFNSVTNLLNAETRYNLILTPLRNFLRWASYVGGCLQLYTSSVYKFVSGEGNYDLETDYDCVSGNTCQAIICDNLSERDDIPLSVYNSGFGYLFYPMKYEINAPLEWEDFKVMLDSLKKAIGVSQTDEDHAPFFIQLLEYDLVHGKIEVKAWPKEYFEIQTIIDGDASLGGGDQNALLLESGDYLLLENGDNIQLE